MNTRNNAPIVKGGQGRTAAELVETAEAPWRFLRDVWVYTVGIPLLAIGAVLILVVWVAAMASCAVTGTRPYFE